MRRGGLDGGLHGGAAWAAMTEVPAAILESATVATTIHVRTSREMS
jgi:hypothetical protein